MMKATISLIVTIAIFMVTAIGETAADDLNLAVSITTGEHSRDSGNNPKNADRSFEAAENS